MTMHASRPSLKARLASGPIVVAPGAYDALSAKLIVEAGFEAVYATGAGASYSLLGKPDLGLLSFTEMREQVRRIADVAPLPLIADGDTGHGGVFNVARTVREFESAGASAVHIEDQSFPKRCGHLSGKQLIPVQEMVGKVRAATEARASEDFLIIARTDAIAVEGLEAALSRAGAYADAGADAIMVEAPTDFDMMRRICREIAVPQMVGQVEGGKTPPCSASELEAIGYRLVIFPNSATRTVAFALRELFGSLRKLGTTEPLRSRMLSFTQINELLGLANYQELDRRYAAVNPGKESRQP